MTLFWGRRGDMWRPKGGQEVPVRDLSPGDLIELGRKLWRVVEVREVPVIDWDERDRDGFAKLARKGETEEAFRYRPVYLIVLPAKGGKRHHCKMRPYQNWVRGGTALVVPEHHPVCAECGELYPCRHLEIEAETAKEMAVLAGLEKIMPGCCWSCGEPVTHRQSSIVFDGDNLLLPGAAPAVFHVRRKGGCLHAAVTYEKRWVQAAEGRRYRLSCPGNRIRHLDGAECSEDPFCPGSRAIHNGSFMDHRYGQYHCLRCADEGARRAMGDLGDAPPGALM